LLFSIFGLANLVRYGVFPWIDRVLGSSLPLSAPGEPSMTRILQPAPGAFLSPWFVLVTIIFLLSTLPIALGYWLASQDKPGTSQWQPLAIAFIVMGALLIAGLAGAGRISFLPLPGVLPLLAAFVWVERAWYHIRQRQRAADSMPLGTRSLM